MTLSKVKDCIEGIVCIGIIVTLTYACSFAWIILLTMKLVSFYYRKRVKSRVDHGNFGHMKYERQDALANYWMILLPVIQVFLLWLNIQVFLSYNYNTSFIVVLLMMEGILLYLFQMNNLRIYSRGILFKQDFYTYSQLKDYVLVKNYRGGYEYYKKSHKKILTLLEDEMEYLS